MSIILRILLVVVSLANCVWVVTSIRKAKMRIENTVFWLLFSGVLLVISLFPQLVIWGAKIAGVQSATNFIFLVIIFILILKVFRLSINVSQLESKLQAFAQRYALDGAQERERERERERRRRGIRQDHAIITRDKYYILTKCWNDHPNFPCIESIATCS